MMRRAGSDPRPAVIERRYNDFTYIYECILRAFHPSILGDFMFPKKVLLGNFKAEVISERTDAFNKFLTLIANCDSLLYSDYFYSFLSSEEHNEAVSHIKLGRYGDAVPLLEVGSLKCKQTAIVSRLFFIPGYIQRQGEVVHRGQHPRPDGVVRVGGLLGRRRPAGGGLRLHAGRDAVLRAMPGPPRGRESPDPVSRNSLATGWRIKSQPEAVRSAVGGAQVCRGQVGKRPLPP